MGSAIGTNAALRLHMDPRVTAIAGIDLEPPRRYIPDAEFHFVQPGDATRVHQVVTDFRPTVVVHAWVFEPRARSSPGQARSRTVAGTESLLGAIAKLDSVERLAVRSGVAIYGSGRSTPRRPTIETPARPTSTFGQILTDVEARCHQAGSRLGITVVPVRLASVMASNLPNPLGRYLRLPVVPVPLTSKRFGVIHLGDATRVMAAAAVSDIDHPLNVMAAEPVSPIEAITIGQRVAVPFAPPLFRAGRALGELAGTPVPEHVTDLMSRGQIVSASDTDRLLDTPLRRTTRDALRDLYSAGRLIEVDRSRLVTKV